MRIKRAGAYQIVNEVNGKSYVGSSKDITNRWGHWRASVKKAMAYKSLLQLAIRKYGIDNFTFILLEECEPTKESLEAIEQKYIDLLKPEYNILPQAYSPAGHKLSEEQKQRMRDTYSEERKQAASKRAIAYMSDPEIRAKYSELRKGKTFEDIFGEEAKEVLERLSAGRTGKRLGVPSWNKGIPITEEQKALLNAGRDAWQEEHGAWNKGVPMPAETKQKVSEALTGKEAWNRGTTGLMPEPWNKGREATPEERQKMSEIGKAIFDPEHQAMMTEAARQANLGKERSEATKQKISEANLTSDARKAFTESRRGVARSDELKQRVSEGIRSSEAFQASVKARVGKIRKDNTSGHYGIIWDKSRGKWLVRVNKKQCGRFADLGDAIACRDAAIG